MGEYSTNQKNNLTVLYEIFTTFSKFEKAGFDTRIRRQYDVYSHHFNKVYIFTAEDKRIDGLPSNIEHIPFPSIPLVEYAYFFLNPIRLFKYHQVKYVEFETTAVLQAIFYKLLRKRLFFHLKMDLAKTLAINGKPILGFLAKILQILSLKIADNVGATTTRLRDEAEKWTRKDKIYLLPNYVDTDLFRPESNNKEHNLLIYVGRFHPEKNLKMLIDVMNKLPQYKLAIVGGYGPSKEELYQYASKQRISNVNFIGPVENEMLPVYLNKAEAFIIASKHEGHPKALIEAMACGLPCIGTNVPGIKEVIIDGETGILCEKTEESIRTAIVQLLDHTEQMRQMGANARKFAFEHYSMEKVLNRKLSLIKGEHNRDKSLFQ
ncbi:glycosyltransferase family 4 protein [Chloroflexota bacterium]